MLMGTQELLVDKYRRSRTALTINLGVSVLQIIVLLLLAQSVSLFGDTAHGIGDNLVLIGGLVLTYGQMHGKIAEGGHGKRILTIVAVFLLFGSACWLAYESLERIMGKGIGFAWWVVLITSLLSALGNFFAHKVMSGVDADVVDDYHKANLAHLFWDFVISFVVFTSALLVGIFDTPAFDPWAAFIIAGFMIHRGWKILFPENDDRTHDGEHHHPH
jgi:divalent metal cation (Fe/Co/Zn/Cd) transporter